MITIIVDKGEFLLLIPSPYKRQEDKRELRLNVKTE